MKPVSGGFLIDLRRADTARVLRKVLKRYKYWTYIYSTTTSTSQRLCRKELELRTQSLRVNPKDTESNSKKQKDRGHKIQIKFKVNSDYHRLLLELFVKLTEHDAIVFPAVWTERIKISPLGQRRAPRLEA